MDIRILVFSEDGSKHAHATLRALVQAFLQLVDSHCRPQRVTFKPADDNLALVSRAPQWTSAKRHHELVALRRTIATWLAKGPRDFVVFHVDGDEPWSRRKKSKNCAQFQSKIKDKVRALLQSIKTDWSEEQIERCMSRLILLMPFYSIEAWTYQNTRHAKKLCWKHHRGSHIEGFDEWERDRASIDEVERPKKTTCLGSKHNQELAENAFPRREAYEAGTSLAAAVDAMRDCDDLVAALRQTWQTWEAH